MTNQRYDFPSVAAWWNSDVMKAKRVALLNGKFPSECGQCEHLPQIATPAYLSHNKRVEPFADEIESLSDDKGLTAFVPRYIQLASHACNFECHMCTGRNSTALATAEKKKFGRIYPVGQLYEADDILSNELLADLELIDFIGGEPAMSTRMWAILRRMIDEKRTDVRVSITSNMSFPGKSLQTALDVLPHFSRVLLICSVDAFGETGEFLRPGWTAERFLSTYNTLRSLPNTTTRWQVTLTSLGLLNFPKLIEEAQRHQVPRVSVHLVGTNKTYLSPSVLSPDAFIEALTAAQASVKGTIYAEWADPLFKMLSEKYVPLTLDVR